MNRGVLTLSLALLALGCTTSSARAQQPALPAGYEQAIPAPPPGPSTAANIVYVTRPVRPPDAIPTRRGFTLEAALGAGLLLAPSPAELRGVGAAALGIGGFLTPELAVTFRVISANASERSGARTVNAVGIFAAIQYWLGARVMFGVGLGMGFVDVPTFDATFEEDVLAGLALEARVGVVAWQWAHHSLLFAYEPMLITDVKDGAALLQTLSFEWQFH
ncbi:MAG: hypothetical protein IPK60_01820 [Sandaracinaceae bacterium]|nr:hypothetical protein [Sandaracinaceae bacterium]